MNPNTLLLPTVWPRAAPTTLNRCVLLAALAHVWLVLTLGHAPGGTARPGEGVWGAVNVTLRGPDMPGAADSAPPPEPAVATGPVGLAEAPRWGGAVRTQQPPDVPPEPGAAQLGQWAPLPEPAAAQPALTPLPRAAVLRPTVPDGPLPEPGRVVEERAVPPPERTLASSLARPLAPAVTAAPALPATTAPAPLPGRLPELSAPAAAPLMAPRTAPPPPAAAVAALPPSPPTVAPLPVAAAPALPPLVAAPALAAANTPAAAPALAAASTPVPMPAPAVTPAPAPVPAPPVAVASVLPTTASPVTAGLPSGGAPAGRADAGTRLGHDVAGAPALPASAPPRLNLQLARPRGGEISRGMGGGMLAVLPRPPEVDDKLGQQIAKTAKVDCRSAYAGAGLLAVVPLVAEALRPDSGCKW